MVTRATTNEAGRYSLLYVPVGTYTIQVEKEGFKTQVQTNLVLTAEQQAGANFTLTVGAINEKVEVSANAQAVETESAALQQVVNQRAIMELPLNGRNPADLVFLTPGTVNLLNPNPGNGNNLSDVGQHQSYTTFPVETGASSSGGRQGSTIYFLDGAYNMDNYHLLAAPFPNADATQEFQVIGNNFDARYGFTPGGCGQHCDQIRDQSMARRSVRVHPQQRSQWHRVFLPIYGSDQAQPVWWIDRWPDSERQAIRLRQLSRHTPASIGAERQRLRANDCHAQRQFWRVLPKWLRCLTVCAKIQMWSTGSLTSRTKFGIPQPMQSRTRRATSSEDRSGRTIQSYTMADVLAHPGMYFPNNQIDPTTFNQAAVSLDNLFPTNTSDQYGRIGVSGWPNINDYNEETFRVDYDLTDNQRISGRGFLNFFNQPPTSISILSSDRSWVSHWQSYAGTWTWTINPHIVNNFTGTYSRLYVYSNSGLEANGKKICYSQFISVSDPSTTPCSIEGFTVGGGYDRGQIPLNAQNFNGINRWTYGFSDSISISKGKHLIVAGVDVMRQYWYENTDWLALPIINWDNQIPNGQYTGSSFADFLLGDVGSYEQGGGESNVIHAWMIAPYVADQYKIKPNLTLDFGLRWEPWIAPVVAGGRIATYIPGEQSTRYPNAPAGLVFPGDRGVASAGLPSNYKKFFDPRVGFAWQPKGLGNTSVRGAFGMFAIPDGLCQLQSRIRLSSIQPDLQLQWRLDCEWRYGSDHSFL